MEKISVKLSQSLPTATAEPIVPVIPLNENLRAVKMSSEGRLPLRVLYF